MHCACRKHPRVSPNGTRTTPDPPAAATVRVIGAHSTRQPPTLHRLDTARRLRSYLLLNFTATWALAGIGALADVRADSGVPYLILAGGCMLMPGLSAVLQHRLIDRAPWSALGMDPQRLRVGPLVRTALVGAAFIPLTLLVCYVLGNRLGLLAFGQVDLSGAHMIEHLDQLLAEAGRGPLPESAAALLARVPASLILLAGIGSATLAAFSVNLPFMLGEELGWRGYLYHVLSHWSMPRRVLFTGTVWGLWHAPLILMGHNYPGHPWLGIPLMVVFCVLLALLFDRSRAHGGTVWGPCVLHGLINGTAGLFALFVAGGRDLVASPVGLAGFLAIALLAPAMARPQNATP